MGEFIALVLLWAASAVAFALVAAGLCACVDPAARPLGLSASLIGILMGAMSLAALFELVTVGP